MDKQTLSNGWTFTDATKHIIFQLCSLKNEGLIYCVVTLLSSADKIFHVQMRPESFWFISVMLSCHLNMESSIFIASDQKHLSDMCCKYMFAIAFFLILPFKLNDDKKLSVLNGTT